METPVVSQANRLEGSGTAMTEARRSFLSGWTRAGLAGLAAGLMLLASGDGARTASAPGGIDPLDILKLQVRPNVMIMLDSSGSMRETTAGNVMAGDFNLSKISQAKQVVATLVRNNQDRVSFMFGKYTQPTVTPTPYPNPPANLIDTMTFPNVANRFMYLTADPNAASMQINPGGSGTSAGRLKRNSATDRQADFNQQGVPITYYEAFAGRYFNGQRVFFSNTPAAGTFCNVGAAVGPPGTTATAGSNVGAVDPVTGLTTTGPYVELQRKNACADADSAAVGPVVKFVFSGIAQQPSWGNATIPQTCIGFLPTVSLSTCNDVLQIDTIENPYLFSEFDILPDGTLAGYREDPTTFALLASPNHNGIRAEGNTPIANSLINIKTIWNQLWTTGLTGPPPIPPISAQTPVKQRTFFVVVTDGDDTCDYTPSGTAAGLSGLQLALRTAYFASLLYAPIVPTDSASSVQTFIVAFGNGATPALANYEAWGGSGMTMPTTGTGTATRWASAPTAAQRAACTTCQDAFIATSAQALAQALQDVIDQTIAVGEFGAAQSIVGTVFELTVDDPATTLVENAFDPNTRYNQRVNILYQTTFELPGWKGHFDAFRNDGTFLTVGGVNSVGVWDAGQTLNDQITVPMQSATRGGRPADEFTFGELHDGQTAATIGGGGSQALIKRRIFTSSGNGTFTRAATGTGIYDAQFDSSLPTGTNVVALWPPNQAGLSSGITDIDPPVGTTGPFDVAFGLTTMTFPQLQTFFGACEASTDVGSGPLPAACNFAGNPTLATQTAVKEAREILLAFTAGAGISLGTDGLTLREATSRAVLFQDRGWLLADTELSAPAIVSPPLKFPPSSHAAEFIIYRDGLRDPSTALGINDVDRGFGLRNPDGDDPNPATNMNLKPVMTVVYLGANDMLHAFRAGPCLSGCGEQGSEELWGFVPFDQLGKLKDLMAGQKSRPHNYVVATSIRVADVFIPDPDGYTFNGRGFTGRWRTVLVFGRGPGGKYYTALDVTSPGQFTRAALQTNPPWIMWNRGNPDTVDGTPTGTPVNASDTVAYSKMGETWSVPAIGNVDPTLGFEWRVFTGSGYGDPQNAGEGATFYQLDAVTGNIVQSRAVPGGDPSFTIDRDASPFPPPNDGNALVAGPAAYNPRAQDPPGTSTHDPIDRVTRVFIPDIQGRIWKFTMASSDVFFDAGPTQPIANSVALLKIADPLSGAVRAHVYAESGNDDRVPDASGPFKMYGLRDDGTDTVVSPATLLFASPFPLPVGPGLSSVPFRGTAQPATAFNSAGSGRVFFLGTRFNPTGTTSCISSFDSIFLGLTAETGGAAYDWSGSPYYVLTGDKGEGIQPVGGGVQISKSVHPSPSPPASPTPTPPAPKPAFILTTAQRTGSPVCRTP
jgi:hypothetical protein